MKPTCHYTNVAQMTEKVNRLNRLLADAKALAEELKVDNEHNLLHLRNRSEEAIAESGQRPLTIPQRITEANRQANAFEVVASNVESAQAVIWLIY